MSAGDITYRSPGADEWKALKDLRVRSVKEHPIAFGRTLEEEEESTEETWRSRLEKRQYITAEKDGVFVGMLSFVQGDNPKSAHTMHLYSVYVAPECRGLGVGRGLLERVIAEAKTRPEVIKIGLNVAASQSEARALYEKMGFDQVGLFKKEIFVDGVYIDELQMELMLR